MSTDTKQEPSFGERLLALIEDASIDCDFCDAMCPDHAAAFSTQADELAATARGEVWKEAIGIVKAFGAEDRPSDQQVAAGLLVDQLESAAAKEREKP
jgi:uncharacterized protein (DUF305 family)